MNYRNVGKSGLKVSEIAVGSWMTDVKGSAASEVAAATIRLAYESGVNFFDCADAYSGGEAEKFLGSALSDYPRSSLVVSSKVFFPTGPGVNDRGLSRKHIFENAERSLQNLGLEYIDLYYCHRFDTETPLEETLQAMSDLVTQGKILYWGVSEEWSAARIVEAQLLCREMGLRAFTVVQPQYNMVDRYIEDEILGVCERYGLGITPFSPLAQGLLTGKYHRGEAYPEGSRATHQADRQINNLLTEENLDKVEKLGQVADDLGITLSVLALSWILSKPAVCAVITGASRSEQLKSNLAASGVRIPLDAMAKIEGILNYHPFVRRVG